MVGLYYGPNEDLGLAIFSAPSKATLLVWLARHSLTHHFLTALCFVCTVPCCCCCGHIFRPGQPSCGGRRVMSLYSRKVLVRAGRSLFCFGTSNVLSPSLRRLKRTGSIGLILPHGAGSSRSWRTRRSARIRLDGSQGCSTLRMHAELRQGPL